MDEHKSSDRETQQAKRIRQRPQPVANDQFAQADLAATVTPSVQRALADPHHAVPAEIVSLQRLGGNRAVSRLLDRPSRTGTQPAVAQPVAPSPATTQNYRTVVTYHLAARIRQANSPASSVTGHRAQGAGSQPQRSHLPHDSDSVEEGETQPEVVTREEGAIMIEESDSVGSTLTYSPSVANDATPPGASEFGVTRTNPSISGVAVTHDDKASAFNVTATVVNTVKWSVHSLGRTDIPDENAAAITKANYADVASDLTPDTTSDNGRPPRTKFWANDLTSRHEQFHANERANTYGKPAFEFARNWLIAQTATDEAGVKVLANQIPDKMFESYDASYVPGKESRAYGDGAPSYKARADAITKKGTDGGYAGANP